MLIRAGEHGGAYPGAGLLARRPTANGIDIRALDGDDPNLFSRSGQCLICNCVPLARYRPHIGRR
jgi:hypothetical protein